MEIDGAVFTVKQIAPEDGTAEYGEKEAELVSRACLLYEEEAEKKAYAPKKAVPNEEVLPEKAKEKVNELTDKAIDAVKDIEGSGLVIEIADSLRNRDN